MAQVRTRKRGKTWSCIFEAGVAAFNDFMHEKIGIASEAVTLEDFMERWLCEVVAVNVKPSPMQTYQSHFRNNIVPHLGEVKIQSLTPAMLDAWLRKLLRAGLARKTLSVIHALIHHALDYAVYPSQLITSNPAAYIKVPKNAPRNVVK